jgi:hypothetical protein
MMKQFRIQKLSPTAQALHDRRNELISKAKNDRCNKRATTELAEEYKLKVYTKAEIKAFVKERPEIKTAPVIGKSYWNTQKALTIQ